MESKKRLSYIRARDPSILALGISRSNNFGETPGNRESPIEGAAIGQEDQEQQQKEHLSVYLRMKHVDSLPDCYEIRGNKLVCHIPEGTSCGRNNRQGTSSSKTYHFSKLFHPSATQGDIFNSVVKTELLSFINGENTSLLTYGISGSGKTYTAIGTAEAPGLVPRTLEYIFRAISQIDQATFVKPQPGGSFIVLDDAQMREEEAMRNSFFRHAASIMNKTEQVAIYENMQRHLSCEPFPQLELAADITLGIWISFAEIYNEHIFDLLVPPLQRGQQKQRLRLCNTKSESYIKDLQLVNVTTALEAYLALQYGIHHLKQAATNLNAHSSRSHSIFTIRVVQVPNHDSGEAYSSFFNFCDLAGSERSKKSQNMGARFAETNCINSSLLVLRKCIQAVRAGQRAPERKFLVPFRESKLTALLQRALSGHENICMVVNVNPARDMLEGNLHTLGFSAMPAELVKRDPAAKELDLLAGNGRGPEKDEDDEDAAAHKTKAQLKDEVLMLKKALREQCAKHKAKDDRKALKIQEQEDEVLMVRQQMNEQQDQHRIEIAEMKKALREQCAKHKAEEDRSALKIQEQEITIEQMKIEFNHLEEECLQRDDEINALKVVIAKFEGE